MQKTTRKKLKEAFEKADALDSALQQLAYPGELGDTKGAIKTIYGERELQRLERAANNISMKGSMAASELLYAHSCSEAHAALTSLYGAKVHDKLDRLSDTATQTGVLANSALAGLFKAGIYQFVINRDTFKGKSLKDFFPGLTVKERKEVKASLQKAKLEFKGDVFIKSQKIK